jgi:hypothetical protein
MVNTINTLMNAELDRPEWTTWLLGEASTEESRRCQEALSENTALRDAVEEQRRLIASIEKVLVTNPPLLHEMQRERIYRMARSVDVQQVPVHESSRKKRHLPVWWGAAAALIVIGFWLGLSHPLVAPKGNLTYEQVSKEIALLPSSDQGFPRDNRNQVVTSTAVGGGDTLRRRDEMWQKRPADFLRLVAQRVAAEPLPNPAELPPRQPRNWLSAEQYPQAHLPIRVGQASWQWTKRNVLEQQQKPHPSLVRVEEWIQAMPLGQGVHDTQEGIEIRYAWSSPATDESVRYLVLSMQNISGKTQSVNWAFIAPRSSQYRLIGFDSSMSHTTQRNAAMAAGEKVQIMLAVAFQKGSQELGAISFRVSDREFSHSLRETSEDFATVEYYLLLREMAEGLVEGKMDRARIMKQILALQSRVQTPEHLEGLMVMKRLCEIDAAR